MPMHWHILQVVIWDVCRVIVIYLTVVCLLSVKSADFVRFKRCVRRCFPRVFGADTIEGFPVVDHMDRWQRARERLIAQSIAPDTRLCPVCLDCDAIDDRARIHGVACSNGHPVCAPCAAKLMTVVCVSLERPDPVIAFRCPMCRIVSWLNPFAVLAVIKNLN